MPTYQLINGALIRDGQALLCPFSSRVLVPAPGKLQNNVGINEHCCGTWCSLFSLSEDFEGQSDQDLPAFVTLHCAPMQRQFDIEIVATKPDSKTISQSN